MSRVNRLDGAEWALWRTAPGEWHAPDDLPSDGGWTIPHRTTVAAALRSVGATISADLDRADWWFRARLTLPRSIRNAVIDFQGVATYWQAFWDGEAVASGRSMFRSTVTPVVAEAGTHDLVLVCRALAEVPTPRRPRPAWRSLLVQDQSLRWHRSAGLGRIGWPGSAPAVGPWKEISLHSRSESPICSLRTSIADSDQPTVHVRLEQPEQGTSARLDGVPLRRLSSRGAETDAVFAVPHRVEPWWPHTHGEPRLHALELEFNESPTVSRDIGFRTIDADRTGGGFALVVNGHRVFARGAVWAPPDPLTYIGPPEEQAGELEALVEAGANIVRLPGTGTWQDENFHRDCARLGLMVWQDCMLHTLAPPDDEEFLQDLAQEVAENVAVAGGYPSLAVVCGGSETEQQPTLWGLPRETAEVPALRGIVRHAAEGAAPGIPYLTSSPSEGPLPTSIRTGVSHYFGVGAYRRDLSDARLSGVRFASECLAFAIPPEQPFIDLHFGGAASVVTDSDWSRGIAKDPTATWDFLQVLEHYTARLFNVRPGEVRDQQPDRWLDLVRATATHLFETTFSEWRRPGSACDGGIVLSARDLIPGAGWGLTDSQGGWKSALYGAARAWSPISLLMTDEGLDGVDVHVVNDGPESLMGSLEVEVWTRSGHRAESAQEAVNVSPHSALTRSVLGLIGSFRDITNAWGFGEAEYDAVVARLSIDGRPARHLTHLLGGPSRDRKPDLGLAVVVADHDDDAVTLVVSTVELATFVSVEVSGWHVDRNWFHLPPGGSSPVVLTRRGAGSPRVTVRALNSVTAVSLDVPRGDSATKDRG